MNKQHIKKKYESLMVKVKNDPFYTSIDLTDRLNCYVCTSCNHVTKTRDIDSGVTPFIYSCEHCSREARSTFYQDIMPHLEPTFEWYRPPLEDVLKIKDDGLLDHILNGGLDVRKIKQKSNK